MEIVLCAFIGAWIALAGLIAYRSLKKDFDQVRREADQ
jgi:hypothetical protein